MTRPDADRARCAGGLRLRRVCPRVARSAGGAARKLRGGEGLHVDRAPRSRHMDGSARCGWGSYADLPNTC